jgi:signal transduction histidine kinase
MSDPWSAALFRETLQLIAEGVTELVGFEVAAVSVVGDDGRLEVIAVAGSEDCRDQLLGHRTPIADIQAEISNSEAWGALRFVPHERMGIDTENLGWIPDIEVSDDPDAWHPLDLLLAPFYGEDGQLRGIMSMDVPTDGKRPRPETRRQLQKYVEQAGRAVIAAHDRARLAEQVRLAETAREVIRRASAENTLEGVFDYVQKALVEGFNARGLWIRTFHDIATPGSDRLFSSQGDQVWLPPALAAIGKEAAEKLWALQEVVVVSPEHRPDLLTVEEHADVVGFLKGLGVDSMVFAPLGAGQRCLGNFGLTRTAGQGDWTETEKRAALDIGHDLGRTLLTTQNLERERRLNEELRTLDSYKSQLIATVSHELRNPLTAVAGYLEILADDDGLSERALRSIASMTRGVGRMSSLVDDLLTLSRVADPSIQPRTEPVDLRSVVEDVLDMAGPTSAQKDLTIHFAEPTLPVQALAERDDVDRVVANLVSNAMKYSPHGTEIDLDVFIEDGEAVLRVADHGIGISEADQRDLFREFYRTANPEALREQGTGLGLAIVQRIVERHHGHIEVQSTLGKGTTFTVRLPRVRGGEGAAASPGTAPAEETILPSQRDS